MRSMTVAATSALFATGALILMGCASEGGGSITTVTETVTATIVATVTATPAPTIPGLPTEITGAWCTDLAPDDCFDPTQILAEYPDAFVEETSEDTGTPGATRILLCKRPATSGVGCDSNTYESLYEYLPAGVAWDCEAVARTWGSRGYDDCDPDYSSVHDTTRPRLLHLVKEQQQNAEFEDVPPLYQQAG